MKILKIIFVTSMVFMFLDTYLPWEFNPWRPYSSEVVQMGFDIQSCAIGHVFVFKVLESKRIDPDYEEFRQCLDDLLFKGQEDLPHFYNLEYWKDSFYKTGLVINEIRK